MIAVIVGGVALGFFVPLIWFAAMFAAVGFLMMEKVEK